MLADESGSETAGQKGLDRILALSDGVFAFAITLLVLSLAVPSLSPSQSRTDYNLLVLLSGDINTFYSYALSFVVISIWWISHHRLFRHISKYNSSLMWTNLFFLLFITIIPFLTELVSQYGDIRIAVIIYDLTQAIGGLVLSALWNVAIKNHLLSSERLTKAQIRNIRIRTYVPTFVFLLAIGISFVLPPSIPPGYANFALFAMFPLMRFASRQNAGAD
jgi:uncharacterized membrane protein